MKLSNKYKTVLFYGNILCVETGASFLAADDDGEVCAYDSKPTCMEYLGVWRGEDVSSTGAVITFGVCESWKDTLTYCEGEGQEWMLDLKTKIAVQCALLQDGSITQQKALCNVMEASPFVESFIQPQWEGFRKHSGVEAVAGKEFLDALEEKIKRATTRYIEVEKREGFTDDGLFVCNYYGAELVIPAWVNFIAMDNDGRVWGYEEQPEAGTDGEWSTEGCGRARTVGLRGSKTGKNEWRNSLREVQQ
uniref:Uncharacterized protein n=1 Tax=Podoviridae sp. ctlpi2 TaxID=2826574 RepID=A0A8S5MLQ0_9CAUD|nr:MAG TPA: hypothetical protein [Podoviridae sp. ctlpi2]